MSYLSKIFNVIAGSGLLILGYSHYRTSATTTDTVWWPMTNTQASVR